MTPPWLAEPEVRALVAAFAAAGLELRFVGGAVRDALLGRESGDIDAATPARPEAVAAALAAAGIRARPTGLAHGTVTAALGRRRVEITSLRRDVATDGRHAVVAFGASWEEDARRRDFTINAIYLGPDGTVHDPVGGAADLAARRVRFIGEARRRIAEDVLRLLRYYRFEARFGAGAGDAEARAACRAAAPALAALSAGRVTQELLGLLAAPEAARAVRLMHEDGVLAVLLPEAAQLDRLARLCELEPEPDPLRRLAALGAGAAAAARLALPAAARRRLAALAEPWPLAPEGDDRAQRRALYRLGRERYRDLALLLAAAGRLAPDQLARRLGLAAAWQKPEFPLTGADVAALGIAPGPRTGRLLGAVRHWWEDGDFAAGRSACLARLREIADERVIRQD